MSYYGDEDIDRAAKAYSRWCDRNGFVSQQPSRYDSDRDGDVITLRNTSGELARYRVQPSGRLAHLDD